MRAIDRKSLPFARASSLRDISHLERGARRAHLSALQHHLALVQCFELLHSPECVHFDCQRNVLVVILVYLVEPTAPSEVPADVA